MEKISLLINQGFQILGRKMDNLAMELRNKKAPIVNSQISISEDVSKGISQAVSKSLDKLKIPTPQINIPEQKTPVVNVPAPIVNVETPIVNVPPANITIEPTPVTFPLEMKVVGMQELIDGINNKESEPFPKLLEGINNKNPIPVQIVDGKGKPLSASDFGGGGGPSTVGLRIGTTVLSAAHPLPVAMGFQIPVYDTEVINEALAPATTVITYKKSGVTVATKTISVSGTTTTITVV